MFFLYKINILCYNKDAGSYEKVSFRIRRFDYEQIYDEYFGQPNSEKSHHLLHTTYTKRDLYN